MPSKKDSDKAYLPKSPSAYTDNRSEQEQREEKTLKAEYDSIHSSNPELSQREREHLTYLKILEQYNEAKSRRTNYRRYGFAFIIISGLVFLTLIFSLDTKIEFLCLWIVTILYCVAVMIRADYKYHTFKEFLGIADEFDYRGTDDDDRQPEAEPPKPQTDETKTEICESKQNDDNHNDKNKEETQ